MDRFAVPYTKKMEASKYQKKYPKKTRSGKGRLLKDAKKACPERKK